MDGPAPRRSTATPDDGAVLHAGTAWIVMQDGGDALRLATALRDQGWEVPRVVHGLAPATGLLDGVEAKPDVILCGLRFDDGDALQLIRHLAQHPRRPALFIASRQQRAVIKSAVALADVCRVEVAGFAERPDDSVGIVRTLSRFRRAGARAERPRPLPLDERQLRQVIAERRVEAWMQPKMRIATREIVGFEALMRATSPDGSIITPDRLVDGMRAHGLLADATMQMALQAIDFVRLCLEDGMAISASINASMQSLSDPAFCREIARAAEAASLDPSWITIEITESDAMADVAAVMENATRIRMHGFNLAIDDFGTAYSSFFQLSRIPFSELKIERAFVAGAAADPNKVAIIEACAQLGTSLDLHVVAEGVETREELDVVTRARCTEVQGYLIARPAPVARTIGWLRNLPDLCVPV